MTSSESVEIGSGDLQGMSGVAVVDTASVRLPDPRVRRPTRSWTRLAWVAVVIALFAFPLFIGLGRSDLENDEAIHSLVLEHLLATGDWLTPRSPDGTAFIEKPPLKFWIAAIPIRFGLVAPDEFGVRVCDAAMGALAFLYVFAVGRRLGGPLCGLAALVILFAHQPLIFSHGFRTNNMEAAVFLSYCAGVYHFLVWKSDANVRRRRRHLFGLALAFVLGFMVKFVAVLFLPIALAPAALLSVGIRARLREDWRTWLAAAGLATALIAPWFLYQYHQWGSEAWKVIVGDHVVKRFTAYLDKDHLHPWYFYWTSLWHELRVEGALPIVVAGLVIVSIQSVRHRLNDGVVLLCWFAVPLVLMSSLTSKIYHYAYPYLPPLALAGGYLASLIVARVWLLCKGWSERVDGLVGQRVAAAVRREEFRVALCAIGVLAAAAAAATYVNHGPLRIAAGDAVLFRNASVLRPSLVAILMFVLAGRIGLALRAGVAAAVVALLLPVSGYARSVANLPVESHPLRSVGQCMQRVGSDHQGEVGPGIWVEAETLAHFYFYYFRGLGGPWRQRDTASDPTVYMHMYVPSQRTPVLLSPVRYEQFRQAMQNERDLQERAARKAGMDLESLRAEAGRTYTALVRFPPGDVLILPGPFGACAPEYRRGGGR